MKQRKYRLCSSPGRFLTGHLPDGRQVLMGVSCPHFELYFFDLDGNFMHVENRELSIPPTLRDGIYFFDQAALASLDADIGKWSSELLFTEAPIQIYSFAANYTCIEDLPSELMELEEHPDNFSEDDREELLAWKEEWIESGLYALWWGDELWIDPDGAVNTS